MPIIGVYKITSPIGKVYIGQSVDIKKRFRVYKSLHCKNQVRLYRSFVKHGVNNHLFDILKECGIDDLNKIERHYQDEYNVLGDNGLNCKITTTKSKTGYLSEKTKLKMKNSSLKISEETKQKISIANKGKKRSDEIRKNISEYNKGKKHTEEHKDKIRNSMLGRKMSDESKIKLSKARKGILTGNKNRSKIVLDFNTGVFYNSLSELVSLLKISRITFYDHLTGKTKNNKFKQYKYV